MLKRIFDIILAIVGLLLTSPITLPVILLVWWQDKSSPFYIAPRVGKKGELFKMIKLRSMIKNADKTGVDSTPVDDHRITPVGHFIRRYKLDELSQLLNVLIGDMTIVGPRPNVKRETDLYTSEEIRLLDMKPGITDLSSIVFSDEGDILKEYADPDIAYNQLIRPGKSMLGLFYIEHSSLLLDIKLCFLTLMSIVSRPQALLFIERILLDLDAPASLVDIAKREKPLSVMPPPGSDNIVTHRDYMASSNCK